MVAHKKLISHMQNIMRNVGRNRKYKTIALAGAMVFLVGASWVVFAVSPQAATDTTASLEGENGNLACATKVTDTGASGGSAVNFASCSAGGTGPLSLDKTGATIPDTNYSISAGAVFMDDTGNDANAGTQAAPVKTINKALSLIADGGTIVMRGGTYRDWYNNGSGAHSIVSKAFTLQAYPHEQAWFDGTDVVSDNWASDGAGHWKRAWNTPSFCDGKYYTYDPLVQPTTNTGPCSHYDVDSSPQEPAVGDPQAVWIGGTELYQVESLAKVTSTSFYYDWANKQIYLGTDPATKTVELATRPVALVLGGSGVRSIKGVGFKRYASNEYNNLTGTAVFIGGSGIATVESSVFRDNSGKGLTYSNPREGSYVKNSVIAYNGINGMGSNGSNTVNGLGNPNNLLIEGNVFYKNNNKKFGYGCTVSCASSQIKMANMNGYTFRNNVLIDIANGSGVWCDTRCTSGVIINNYVTGTEEFAIFDEINDGTIIASNLTVDNHVGINVVGSNVKVYNNTVVNSSLIGMRIFDDSRSEQSSNISIVNNVLSGKSTNVNWFVNQGQVGPNTFLSKFDYNSYWRPTENVLYRWIDPATNDVGFKTKTTFRAAHPSWEANAQDFVAGSDPFFVDTATGNYRIRTNSQAYNSSMPLPADIAAALGLQTGVVLSRGALSWPGSQ